MPDSSTSPRRIQRRRTRGWRMPDNTVYVGRPGKWGNPWSVAEWHSLLNTLPYDDARAVAADCFYSAMVDRVSDPDYLEHEHPGFYPPLDQIRDELAGKNLACWCPEDQPCHGDTLLKIANGQAL